MVIDSLIAGRPDMALTALRHLALPAITLALPMAAVLMQITRTAAMEVMRADYITFAARLAAPSHPVSPRAEERTRTRRQRRCDRDRRHAWSGNMIAEHLRRPGVGRLVVEAIFDRNYPLVQAAVLLYAVLDSP